MEKTDGLKQEPKPRALAWRQGVAELIDHDLEQVQGGGARENHSCITQKGRGK